MCTIIEYHRYVFEEVETIEAEIADEIHCKGIAKYKDVVEHCDTGSYSDEESLEMARRWLKGHVGKVLLYFDDEEPIVYQDPASLRELLESMLQEGYLLRIA